MAFATASAAPRRFGFGAFFNAIYSGLIHIGEANSRVREAERLQSLSDQELSRLGIKREDIARHVFRDILYV